MAVLVKFNPVIDDVLGGYFLLGHSVVTFGDRAD